MANVPRTILALILLAGVYVSVLLVASIDLAFMVVPILADVLWHGDFSLASLSELLASVTAPGLLALWYGLLVLRRMGEPWKSIRLPADGVDPLRKLIAEVADAAGTDPPADLRLTAIPNAGVTEVARPLSLRGGSRTLYLGLPLLAGMSVDQLRAVLSHEMGHYAGGHSRPGRLAHRGLVALTGLRTVMRMLLTSPPRRIRILWPLLVLLSLFLRVYAAVGYAIFTGYQTLYRRLSFAVRRRQEFEADAIAEQVVGGAELAAALRRIHVLGAAWGDFHNRFLVPMQRAGCTPDDPFEEFGRMLADDTYQQVLAGFEREQDNRLTSADDTHPCLPDRLARLSAGTGATGDAVPSPADGRDATALLPALLDRPWSAQLAATLRPPGGRQEALLWDECVNRTGQAQASAQADRLVREAVGADRPTPASVLRSVAVRRGELATALAGRPGAADSADAPGADAVGLLAGRLFAFLAFTMVAGGHARWRASWRGEPGGGNLALASWDGTDFATEQLAARVGSFAVAPTELNESWLLDHLRSLGIDPSEPVDLTVDVTTGPAAPVVAAAPGDIVVIRPMSEPGAIRNERTLTWIVAGALALTAVAVGAGVSMHNTPQSPSALPVTWAPPSIPSYPAYPGLTEPTRAVPNFRVSDVLPTSVFDPALWPGPKLGGIAGCPPPLLTEECTKVVVAKGDTLSRLACGYRTTVAALQQLNGLGASTKIYAGEALTVPYQKGGPARCG